MASPERSGRLARIGAICLMLLPIHTLPLLAAEKAAPAAAKLEPEQKKTLVGKLIGIASYYAKRFHGRKTTSGEEYHPDKMTAAHPTLPLGTRVLVKNLANNKEVTVVVNDRCRKKAHPFIDLSRAAAQKLGFFGEGKARVAIIPLTEEESLLRDLHS